tara:strand:+ start:5839 stop:6165 length:327 start_codon:yes stop_codon:yes gene_type:complete
MANKIDINKLKQLKNTIESMDAVHHPKILDILKTNNIHISSNRNGCFINMNLFTDQILKELNDFINYINIQEKTLGAVESAKKNLKVEYFNNNKKDNKETTSLLHNSC